MPKEKLIKMNVENDKSSYYSHLCQHIYVVAFPASAWGPKQWPIKGNAFEDPMKYLYNMPNQSI